MAMNFPDSPSDDDRVTLNGKVYTYEAAASKWSPVGGSNVGLFDTAPESPLAGDLWYNTDNGTMNVYYNDGSSSQWVGVSGSNGSAGANGLTGSAGGAATTYADITARDTASPSAGEMAWVISNTSLYIWDGTEWDRVYSGVESSPAWTTAPETAYSLESAGVASQVTIVAIDPEGFDIDYSVSITPANQTQATVVHAGNGVFDITPALDDGTNDGTFTARFSASDGLVSLPFYSTFELASYNDYEAVYIAASSGSVINVTYQGSGVQDITSVVQGSTNGDSILLTPGTYELTPLDAGNANDVFHNKHISIVGKTNTPHEVVLTVNSGGGRDHGLFNGSTTMANHFANMRIVRKNPSSLTYTSAITAWSSSGVAHNCIIDLDGGYISWAYNSMSPYQGVWKNCSFVNYLTGFQQPWSGYNATSNLVLNCAFELVEHINGRSRWSYDGSTFTADTASGTGTNISFASTTYDYTDKTLFGHMKDVIETPIMEITAPITKEQWYGV